MTRSPFHFRAELISIDGLRPRLCASPSIALIPATRISNRVRGLGPSGDEEILLRTGEQPLDDSAVARVFWGLSRVLAAVRALDFERLSAIAGLTLSGADGHLDSALATRMRARRRATCRVSKPGESLRAFVRGSAAGSASTSENISAIRSCGRIVARLGRRR